MHQYLFILLAAKADSDAKVAELLAPILSGLALILSASAFIFTVIIQLKERRRNLRQTLSTALSDIARINVEVAKLQKDENGNIPESMNMRKSYNSQRGTLASGANFLINQNKKLVTDADCELMALTYDDLGEVDSAKAYWEQAVNLASNPSQKSRHERDYAAFLFQNNEEEKGRDLFRSTTKEAPEATDRDLGDLCNIYITWADLERGFGNDKDYKNLHESAKTYCKKIRNSGKRATMSQLLDHSAGKK
jgi:tetratricopeptide (TPR) repeat protein